MTIFPVIAEGPRVSALRGARPASLLALPLGTGTVLSRLQSQISALTGEQAIVLIDDHAAAEFGRVIQAAADESVRLATRSQFRDALEGYEPSDRVLFVDPRFAAGIDLDSSGLTVDVNGQAVSVHVLVRGNCRRGAQEYVRIAPDGHVRSIRRYYEGITHLRSAGVAASLIPVAAIHFACELTMDSPTGLRDSLTACGLPSRDIIANDDVFDLSQEHEILALNERFLHQLVARPPRTHRKFARGVFVGRNCRIDSSARLIGPVVIQDGAVIGAAATVIGPAVVGSGARVGDNSIIAQGIVAAGAIVSGGTVIRQRLHIGDAPASSSHGASESRRRYRPSAVHIEHEIEPTEPRNGSVAQRSDSAYERLKLIADSLLAALGLLVLSPLFLITAVLIKFESRGPVFFSHTREGKGGRLFRCWKFRTMVDGAHAQQRDLQAGSFVDGPQFKVADDPRVTPLGNWLRSLNIDELPQLFNVVMGQMSLIGPRPSPFRENQICVPWRRARLSVRPGITGLWQICRENRSDSDFHQWIYYDMLYVRHMSLQVDVRILATTILSLGGRWSIPLSWIIPPGHSPSERLFASPAAVSREPAISPVGPGRSV